MKDLIKISIVRYDLPFMINLPDNEYKLYFDNTNIIVKLQRLKSSKMSGIPKEVVFPDNTYIEGDRWGKFNYTKVIVSFHHQIFIKPSIIFSDYIFLKSIDVINRILSVCRGIRGDHYIKMISSDIFSHEVYYYNMNNEFTNGNLFRIGDGNFNIGFGRVNEPSSEELDSIKQILSTNAQLPYFQELLFDAWDFHFYRNYRSAIIESGTAFEVFIYDSIRKGYLQQKKTQDEIDCILEKTPFKNLLVHHIKIITDYFFDESSDQFNNWNKVAYSLRNNVVHKGKKVSDVESHNAITVVADTIRFLLSLKYLQNNIYNNF